MSTRVGVIRGGISNEYDVSLATGGSVLSALKTFPDRYTPVDVLITKDGTWHINGRAITPEQLRAQIDVAWNALHGYWGEDGQFSQLLDSLNIPYTGSTAVPSAVAMNKRLSKEQVEKLGIAIAPDVLVPDYRTQDTDPEEYFAEAANFIAAKLSPPWVVKPQNGGSSIGVFIVKTRDALLDALEKVAWDTGDILVEEYIKGREATVATTDDFRDESVYAFLPVEIRTPKDRFFDYEMKYSGKAEEIAPGRFSQYERSELERMAKEIHRELGLRHYARSDFIVAAPHHGKTPQIYFLEVNTLPGLTSESLLPKAVESVGATLPEFIDHVLQLALQRN